MKFRRKQARDDLERQIEQSSSGVDYSAAQADVWRSELRRAEAAGDLLARYKAEAMVSAYEQSGANASLEALNRSIQLRKKKY